MESHGQFHTSQAVFFLHSTESWVRGVVKEIKEVPKKGGQTEVVFTCQAMKNATLLPGFTSNSGSALVTPLREEELHPVVGDAALASIASAADTVDFDVSGADTYSDLLDLSYLHDSTLLDQVRRRYFSSLIYTHIGPIVLALNPYDYALKNYTDGNMPKYFAEGDAVVTRKSENLPHAWTTAHYAYWLMTANRRNQSVIVSGESGAGKTETAKIVVKYLGKVSTSLCSEEQRQDAEKVTERVNLTSPILEAFGNAKTRMNDNSSRFGKFMKVFFNVKPSGGVMVGAAIEVYLLEKSRIITHGSGERGYHSFYQLLRADSPAKQALKKDLHVDDADQYPSLNVGQATVIPGVNDAQDFEVVAKAMAAVGLSENEQSSVWKVIAGIIHFLSFQFKAITEDECALDRQATPAGKIEAFTSTLSVDIVPMEKELTVTNNLIRGEVIPKKLRKAQAIDLRDAIAKCLYEALFLWLVAKINTLICPPAGSLADGWIALLDIFGFENFAHGNSFEQLCINLANETLQNHYNNIIFTRDMDECKAEGINTASVQFYDNQVCLDLVCGLSVSQCGPGGAAVVTNKLSIMHLLDEESALSNGTDQSFCDKIVAKYNPPADGPGSPKGKAATAGDAAQGHPNFSKPKTQNNAFLIKHYAGEVKYTVDGFRNKNLDTTKETLKDVFRQSTNPFVAQLLGDAKSAAANKQTVGTFYKSQLIRLMTEINSAHPHWIRCVKPHSAKKPRMFHGMEVMTQLRSAGVLETVRIRQQSFSVRTPFDEFLLQFKLVLASIPSCLMPVKGAPRQNAFLDSGAEARCQEVLRRSDCSHHSLAQVGKTKVFMRTEGFYKLSNALKALRAGLARVVQSYSRSYLSGKKARCLQLNSHVTRIACFLQLRPSQTVVRRIQVQQLEAYLLVSLRSVLLLQTDETKVRASEREHEEQEARTAIYQLARQGLERLRAQWEAAKKIRDDHHCQVLCNTEQGQRSDLGELEHVARRLLVAFVALTQQEENSREAITIDERQTRQDELGKRSRDVREQLALYILSVFEAQVAAVQAAQGAGRQAVADTEARVFCVCIVEVRTLCTAWDANRRAILSEAASVWTSIGAAEGAAWAAVKATWWEQKALRDQRATAEHVKLERTRRAGLAFEHEQLLIALLEKSCAMEQSALALEATRLREEEEAETRQRMAEDAERLAEQQRLLDEQRQKAQVVWLRAKAEEQRLAQVSACEQQQRDLARQQAELSKEYALECRKREAAGGPFTATRLSTLTQFEKFRQRKQAIHAAIESTDRELEALQQQQQQQQRDASGSRDRGASLGSSQSPNMRSLGQSPPKDTASPTSTKPPTAERPAAVRSVNATSTMELLEKLSWTKLKPQAAAASGRARNRAVTDSFTMSEVQSVAALTAGSVAELARTTNRLAAYRKVKQEKKQDRTMAFTLSAASAQRHGTATATNRASSPSTDQFASERDGMAVADTLPPAAVTFAVHPAVPVPSAFSLPSSGGVLRSPMRSAATRPPHVVASINPFSPNWRPPQPDEVTGRPKAFLPDGSMVLLPGLSPAPAAAASDSTRESVSPQAGRCGAAPATVTVIEMDDVEL